LIDEAARRELTIREALSLFCEREIGRKDERRIEMSVGLARFPFVRDLDGFDFAAQPSIDKKQIRELTAGRFIANAVGEALRRDRTPSSQVAKGTALAVGHNLGGEQRRLRRHRRQ
jgi:hypothetical protein